MDTVISTVVDRRVADVCDFMIHPTEKNIQAVAFTYERKHWQIIDESIADDLSYLSTVAEGDVEVVSRTLDDMYWIVAYTMDNGPVQYYRYDREAQKAEFLFMHRKALEGLALAKMHTMVIKSRDGRDLVSYYTLPVGSDSDGDGYPSVPLPMVLYVPGGPWSRDNWGYNPIHQWLANRGYAVMSVNFRGSTGFGKAFINAGNLEWGGKMHDANISVMYLLYTDEGHGFARPENSLSFFAVTDAFLSECLGGRYEPIGEDFEGSSITVSVGAEEVPGLADAL